MPAKLQDLLRGTFLTDGDSVGNWGFILYIVLLSIIMIASSHSLERKVHKLSDLSRKVRQLRSVFVESQRDLMFMKMESTVADQVKPMQLFPAQHPPRKIIVKEVTDDR